MPDALRGKIRRAAYAALAGLAALLLLLQAIFAVVVRGERWVDHTHDVRLTAERLGSALSAAEAAQRAHLLLGDADVLARYAAASAQARAALDDLARLIRDNPAQVARVQALRPLVERRLADLGRPVALLAASDRDGALRAAREGMARAAPIPAALEAIQAEEATLLARREGRVQVLQLVFVGGGLAMGALLATLLWRRFRGAAKDAEREARERAAIERMLDEKLRLLREVNHRVGNGMAMVGALLHVQTRGSRDGRVQAALEEARARVAAVGRVHRRIMNAGTVDTLDMGEHLPALCAELALALGRPGAVEGTADPGTVLDVDAGVAVSLVVNELASAALDARPAGGGPGPVRVALLQGGGGLALVVTDPGGRLPDVACAPAPGDVRAMVLCALVGQLGATVAAGGRAEVRLAIPRAA